MDNATVSVGVESDVRRKVAGSSARVVTATPRRSRAYVPLSRRASSNARDRQGKHTDPTCWRHRVRASTMPESFTMSSAPFRASRSGGASWQRRAIGTALREAGTIDGRLLRRGTPRPPAIQDEIGELPPLSDRTVRRSRTLTPNHGPTACEARAERFPLGCQGPVGRGLGRAGASPVSSPGRCS